MTQKELLKKAIELDINDEFPLFKGLFIIPQKQLHDSGYKQMYIVGHTDFDKEINDFKYYLIGTYSDVINLQPVFENMIHGLKMEISELSLDINKHGIIHLWLRNNEKMKIRVPYLSSCILEVQQ